MHIGAHTQRSAKDWRRILRQRFVFRYSVKFLGRRGPFGDGENFPSPPTYHNVRMYTTAFLNNYTTRC
jgi:hypothetical protein